MQITVPYIGQDPTQIPVATLPHNATTEYVLVQLVGISGDVGLSAKILAAATQLSMDLATSPHVTVGEAIQLLGVAGVITPQLATELATADTVIEPLLRSGAKLNIWTLLPVLLELIPLFTAPPAS